MSVYPDSLNQSMKLAEHPSVSAAFALDKRLWDGRKVCVRAITRGAAWRQTTRRLYYGTLRLDAGDAHQIGVEASDGHVRLVHRSRAVDVYDLTRTKK